MNPEHLLSGPIAATATASSALTSGAIAFIDNNLTEAKKKQTDLASPSWGDALFSAFWARLEASAFSDNKQPSGMAAYFQIIDQVTRHLRQSADWQPVYRSEHYLRAAKALTSIGAVDQACEYFMWVDEEDKAKRSALAGDLLRTNKRYETLRKDFLDGKMDRSAADFHDGSATPEERSERLVRAVMAMPRLYVASRCQTGLWRVVWMEKFSGEIQSMYPCLRAVEEPGVFCEGIARLLDGGPGSINSHKMLGALLQPGTHAPPLALPLALAFSFLLMPILLSRRAHSRRWPMPVLASRMQWQRW